MERIMGLDLGSRTLGIAVSDPLGMIARTVETFRFADDDYDAQLAKELGAVKFVLGLPKHMNGDVGIRGQISLDFKAKLEAACGLPVILQDERLTTAAAERILISADVSRKKRKAVIDQMAAVQILQSYLDQKR
ncbi:Holliday junction resolvase RuvX [Holdemania filiformis]|uniref:Holliday junction resolvase RuvX n=1 Tax=Holdemania filiformis TaxID=61171 RepID=UPI00266F0E38|nr:Holliday junction resolvase RuvX [Holdemania filiformis]